MDLSCSDDVLQELEKYARKTSGEVRLVQRCSIVLALLEGQTVSEVADLLGLAYNTVHKWASRFSQNPTINGLKDESRSGSPCTIPSIAKVTLIAIACSPREDNKTGYSYSELSDLTEKATGVRISVSHVQRICSNAQIRPHRVEMWLHSSDPDFRLKAKEICELYLDPPEGAHVISVDEKPGMQALERKFTCSSPRPGQPFRMEYEYKRHGTQTLIASFNVQTGQVYGHCGHTRKADDLIEFMEDLALQYPTGEVHIIWDNLNIHHGERWDEFNKRHGGRFHFHYTPIHASWLNQIEIYFSIMQKRVLKNRSFESTEELQDAVIKFMDDWNESEAHPFKWTFNGTFEERQKECDRVAS